MFAATPNDPEIKLKDFINSTWFKGLARLSMIMTGILFTGFVAIWGVVAGNTDNYVKKVDTQVQQIAQTLAGRIKDEGEFQTQTGTDLSALRADISNLKVDVRVALKLLQQMNNGTRDSTLSSFSGSAPTNGHTGKTLPVRLAD